MSDPERAEPSVDAVTSAWENVEREWGSDAAHERFLAVCVASHRMPEAGKLYRRVRDDDPARAVEAKRRIDALLAIAAEQLLVHKTTPPEKGTPRITFVAVGVALMIVAVTLWQLARLR